MSARDHQNNSEELASNRDLNYDRSLMDEVVALYDQMCNLSATCIFFGTSLEAILSDCDLDISHFSGDGLLGLSLSNRRIVRDFKRVKESIKNIQSLLSDEG